VLSSHLQANPALHRPYVVAGMRLLSACWAPEVVVAHPAALSVRLSSGLVHLVGHISLCSRCDRRPHSAHEHTSANFAVHVAQPPLASSWRLVYGVAVKRRLCIGCTLRDPGCYWNAYPHLVYSPLTPNFKLKLTPDCVPIWPAQVCEAVCPEAPEAEYQLQLQVAQSQEDYIRGRLPHNPYLSGDTGPLMRDVKNFVCTQLDMAGEHTDGPGNS